MNSSGGKVEDKVGIDNCKPRCRRPRPMTRRQKHTQQRRGTSRDNGSSGRRSGGQRSSSTSF